MKMEEKIPVGCGIDEILGGGVEPRVITQIYGPAGVGKTNLCLQLLVNCIKLGRKAVFVDTEGGSSLDRLNQIAGDRFEEVLKKTNMYEPLTFKEQNFIIENLEHVVNNDYGLIVVDCIISLYRVEMEDEKVIKLNRMLSKQLAKLSEFARKYNIAVVVTNQVYSSFESTAEGGKYNSERSSLVPTGGSILKYWSKTIIELKRINHVREAILKRHRSLPEDLKAKFVIVDRGIKDE